MSLTQQKYKTKSKNYFDKLAVKYDRSWDGKYCQQMYTSVLEKINGFSFFSVLDIGCGSGTLLAMIKEQHPAIEAVGIDLSDKMIAQAKILLSSDIVLQTGDVDDIGWPDDTFDLLICNASFHHYPNPEKALQEMQRVLKPQGQLVIGEPWWSKNIRRVINYYLKSPFNASGDVYIYSQAEMKMLLTKSKFYNIEGELIDRTYYIFTAMADK